MGLENGKKNFLALLWGMGIGWAMAAPALAQPAAQQQAARVLLGLATLLPVLLLLMLGKAAFILLLCVLFPGLRERGRAIVATRSGSAFWWGLSVGLAGVIAVLFCLSLEKLGVSGAVGGLGALVLLLLGIGSTALGFLGVAEYMGAEVLRLARRPDPSPLAATAAGLALLMAAGLVPIFGQLLGLLLCAFSLGTFLLALFASKA